MNGTGNPYDDHGHGTHIAGTIGATGFNQEGVIGVSPRVKLMGLKFLDGDGYGNTGDAIKGIEYAINNGADVINASWGGGGDNEPLREAIIAASEIVFVAAAGNQASNNDLIPTYPANYNNLSHVISVAATDMGGGLAGFSNYGRSVHLAAPGSDTFSTTPGGGYGWKRGTSMATPYVSGAAAVLISSNPGITPRQVRHTLITTASRPPELAGLLAADGRLNLNNALRARGGRQDNSVVLCDGHIFPRPGSPKKEPKRTKPSKFKLLSPRVGRIFYTGKRKRKTRSYRRITVRWRKSKDESGIVKYRIKVNGKTVKTLKDPDKNPSTAPSELLTRGGFFFGLTLLYHVARDQHEQGTENPQFATKQLRPLPKRNH